MKKLVTRKVSTLLMSCSVLCLLLPVLPAQAQSRTVHQLGILGDSDEQFETGSYFDSYEIEGSEGQRVSISLDSSEFDTVLGLFDSDGNLVATNNDATETNPNSYISTTLPRNGTYTVVAASYSPQTGGDYRMALRNFSPPRPTRTASSAGSWDEWNALAASPLGQMVMWGIVDSMFSSGGGGTSGGASQSLCPYTRPEGGRGWYEC
ncbi:MAG: PPC domain-containing protein [Cyanobacteria bacterium J06597_16]